MAPGPVPPPAWIWSPERWGASTSRSGTSLCVCRDIEPHAHQITLIYFSHVCIFMSAVGMDAIYFTFWCQTQAPEALHVCLDITIFISFVCCLSMENVFCSDSWNYLM